MLLAGEPDGAALDDSVTLLEALEAAGFGEPLGLGTGEPMDLALGALDGCVDGDGPGEGAAGIA